MKKIYKLGIAVVLVLVLFVILQKVFSVERIFAAGGIVALAATVFAETGLLAGFFLPGDTLLFAAGFFAAQGKLDLALTLLVLTGAAVAGNMVGYEIGKRGGHKLFDKEDSVLLHKDNLAQAQDFFTRHGGKTVILARFVPLVRTLSSPLAGMGNMPYGRFMVYNLIGAVLWVPSVTMVGYWAGRVLGHYINIDHYILPAAMLAVVATFGISFGHVLREPAARERLKKKITSLLTE